MPNSTTIAETVTAGSAAEGIGGSEGTVGPTEGGIGAVQNCGPDWLAISPDPKDDQATQDTSTAMTEPSLIPRIFPVYAFI